MCGLLLATFRFAGLLVMPLPAHVREDARPLNLAAELTQSLLEVLSFGDLDLQNSLTPSGTRLVPGTTPRTDVTVSAA